jgi:hypothetical protein
MMRHNVNGVIPKFINFGSRRLVPLPIKTAGFWPFNNQFRMMLICALILAVTVVCWAPPFLPMTVRRTVLISTLRNREVFVKQALPIRHSKLKVSTAPHTLARKRLTRMLSAIMQKKLALVVAGAGYGKTTLAAQCIAGLKAPFIWYSLDESDGDIATFLAYLIEGIRRHHPDFAAGMRQRGFESLLSPAHRETVLA